METTSHTRTPLKYETRGRVDRDYTGALSAGVRIFSRAEVGILVEAIEGVCVQWAEGIYITPVEPYTHPALSDFEKGREANPPTEEINRLARRIVKTAAERGNYPDIHVDFEGSLSFDLRLPDGRLLLANLFTDGVLDVSVYDDASGKWIINWPDATEADFVSLF